MKSLYLVVFLALIVAVSGCVGEKKGTGTKEISLEINETKEVSETPASPTEVSGENETVAQEVEQKAPKITDEKSVTAGSNPALVLYKTKLWMAYQRFTGNSEDVYLRSFDGKSFSGVEAVSASEIDDMQPAVVSYLGSIYIFFTQTIPGSQTAAIYYKTYDGKNWTGIKKVSDLDDIFYYHNSSAVLMADGNVLLFWTKGKRSDYGFVSSRLLKGDYWVDGITMTTAAAVTDDRNPKVIVKGKDIFVLYDNFVPNGEKSDVYFKKYSDGFWGSGVKLTEDSENKFKSAGSIAYFNEKIYAVWVEQGDLYLRTSQDGLAWSKTLRLTNSKEIEDEPYLAEYNGDLYISYTKYNGNAPYVYLAKLGV